MTAVTEKADLGLGWSEAITNSAKAILSYLESLNAASDPESDSDYDTEEGSAEDDSAQGSGSKAAASKAVPPEFQVRIWLLLVALLKCQGATGPFSSPAFLFLCLHTWKDNSDESANPSSKRFTDCTSIAVLLRVSIDCTGHQFSRHCVAWGKDKTLGVNYQDIDKELWIPVVDSDQPGKEGSLTAYEM